MTSININMLKNFLKKNLEKLNKGKEERSIDLPEVSTSYHRRKVI